MSRTTNAVDAARRSFSVVRSLMRSVMMDALASWVLMSRASASNFKRAHN